MKRRKYIQNKKYLCRLEDEKAKKNQQPLNHLYRIRYLYEL